MSSQARPRSYWVVVLAAWAFVIILALLSLTSFLEGDWVGGVLFGVTVVAVMLMMHTPKWLSRFVA